MDGLIDEGIGRWNVLGFGTNLLSAAVFLSSHHGGVGLCQPAEQGWLRRCIDPWLNRHE